MALLKRLSVGMYFLIRWSWRTALTSSRWDYSLASLSLAMFSGIPQADGDSPFVPVMAMGTQCDTPNLI